MNTKEIVTIVVSLERRIAHLENCLAERDARDCRIEGEEVDLFSVQLRGQLWEAKFIRDRITSTIDDMQS